MDDTDRKLLSLLREDARMSVVELARKLEVARGTVQNRMARLERDGAILGYSVRLRPASETHRIRAVMMIAIDGEHANAVIRQLKGYPEIRSLHTTNGRWDVVAELATDTLEAFDAVLRDVRMIRGISNTETSLLLSTHKM